MFNVYDVEVKTCYMPVVLTVIVTVVNLLRLLTKSVWSTYFIVVVVIIMQMTIFYLC